MSVPLAKRQKSAEGLPPIIFKLPGMKCDTRLLVFDQEFQVHSMILKLHSAFFRKFLDSAEKQNLPPPSTSSFYPSFKYNWVTAVDGDDGEGWHLVSSNEYKPLETQNFKGNTTECQDRFGELLRAFYVMPYVVISPTQLDQLTTLADYYCCLRILSNTVNNAILLGISNEHLIKGSLHSWYKQYDLKSQTNDMLRIAAKLRNPILFRDAIILSVSRWGRHAKPEWIENPKFERIARNAYNQIALLVTIVLSELQDSHRSQEYMVKMREKSTEDDGLQLPMYFRLIYEDINYEFDTDRGGLIEALGDILECNLAFPCPYNTRPGWGRRRKNFLCAKVEDDELPWDIEETDW